MKCFQLQVVALLVTLFEGSVLSLTPSAHIVGGVEAEPHAFPYQVALTINTQVSSFCGGSLLSSEWILTAAHCVVGIPPTIYATFGIHDREVREQTMQSRVAEKIIVHPNYEEKTFRNDIALLKISPVHLIEGIVSSVRLPSEAQRGLSFWNWPVTITGWGRTQDGSTRLSPVLRSVSSRVVSNVYCMLRFFTFNINENNICASGYRAKGACQGDSGGPMVIKEEDSIFTLIGVTSFVAEKGCGKSFPFGFARVTSYLDWIYNETGLQPRLN